MYNCCFCTATGESMPRCRCHCRRRRGRSYGIRYGCIGYRLAILVVSSSLRHAGRILPISRRSSLECDHLPLRAARSAPPGGMAAPSVSTPARRHMAEANRATVSAGVRAGDVVQDLRRLRGICFTKPCRAPDDRPLLPARPRSVLSPGLRLPFQSKFKALSNSLCMQVERKLHRIGACLSISPLPRSLRWSGS